MNTPAHVVASLVAFRAKPRPQSLWPAVAGAVLPDAPMFLFYAYEKFSGQPEHLIWSALYFRPGWQTFFDLFNSVPLVVCGLLLAGRFGWNGLFVLFGSMLLHFACDLPLHHDDAHRHFLPLSLWRFESPVSYWDPKRFGWITAPLEMILTAGGCVYLSWRPSPPGVRFVAGSILGIYALFVCFAIWMWAW
jgi:hypothetical protein